MKRSLLPTGVLPLTGRACSLCLLGLTLAFSSCREAPVTSYRIPKETENVAPAATAAPASGPVVTVAGWNVTPTAGQ